MSFLAGHFPELEPTPAPRPPGIAPVLPGWRERHYGPSVAVVASVLAHGTYTFSLQCGHTKAGQRKKKSRVRCVECRG
jgi:hypothetical protein